MTRIVWVFLGMLLVVSAFTIAAMANDNPNVCMVTFRNDSDAGVAFYGDGIFFGYVNPRQWNTEPLNKIHYPNQPWHFEARVDVNRNGNPVTVKEDYVDLSQQNEYTWAYP